MRIHPIRGHDPNLRTAGWRRAGGNVHTSTDLKLKDDVQRGHVSSGEQSVCPKGKDAECLAHLQPVRMKP